MGTVGGVPRVLAPREAVWARLCWLVTLAGACAGCWVSAAHAGLDDLSVRASADYTWDDNVPRAPAGEELSDSLASLSLNASLPFEITSRSRLLLNGTLGGDAFFRYTGLNNVFGEVRAELQARGSGGYLPAIWGIFLRARGESYNSELRDGYRFSAGVSVRKPLTDRVFLFGAASYNQGDARSEVFDTQELSLRGNLDYSWSPRHTLYLGLEYKDGHSVSTAPLELALLDIAQVVVQDDVFTNPQRFDYRFQARTGILNLGYNFAIGQRQALDISYRIAYSQPKEQPPSAVSTQTVYYVDQQITISYLIRF